MSAVDAAKVGIVHGVADSDQGLLRDVDAFLDTALKAFSHLGLTMTKHALHAGTSSSSTLAEALQLEDRQQVLCLNNAECMKHGARHVSSVAKLARSKL